MAFFLFLFVWDLSAPSHRLLRLGLGVLEVLVGTVGDQTTDEEDGVEADAEAAGGAGAGAGRGRGRVGGGRGGVTGLTIRLLESRGSCWDTGEKYHALEVTDEETVEDLAGLVRVTDVLEGLGSVLAGDVEEDLLTTAGGR